MLHQIAIRLHLVTGKREKLHVAVQLLANCMARARWQLTKRFRRIRRPVVHYYAVCWNEAAFLPFMLAHYERFVDAFYIYDNGSTDASLDLMQAHPGCTAIHFESDGFNDRVHIDIKNTCWKQSRGKADYVVVCDMDEILYHPDMPRMLSEMRRNGYSIIHPQGYDMYSNTYPEYDNHRRITELVRTGVRSDKYSKCVMFDPYRIVDIRYEPGCHQCHPTGIVHYSPDPECKLLHYKNLGLEHLLTRTRQLAARLSDENIQARYGCEYLRNEETVAAEFEQNLQLSENII